MNLSGHAKFTFPAGNILVQLQLQMISSLFGHEENKLFPITHGISVPSLKCTVSHRMNWYDWLVADKLRKTEAADPDHLIDNPNICEVAATAFQLK